MVREGRDVAHQGTAPFGNAGQCRWPGVHDLEVEARLRGKTTTRTRDELAAELRNFVTTSGVQQGGIAAFTVLAIQWMVCGYPSALIRELADELPDDSGPGPRLLRTVCDLYESDTNELPSRLAKCLDNNSLPDLLIAIIHQHRLFEYPLRLPDLGAYAGARQFTGGDPTSQIEAMRAMLLKLTSKLPTSAREEPLLDPGQASACRGPAEQLEQLEQAAERITLAIRNARSLAKELVGTTIENGEAYGQIAGDGEALGSLVTLIENERVDCLNELRQLKASEPITQSMSFEEFRDRIDNCEAKLQESPGSIRNILKRAGSRLRAKRHQFPEAPPAPTGRVQAIKNALIRPKTPESAAEQSVKPSGGRDGIQWENHVGQSLTAAVQAVENALDRNFAEAQKTIDAYPLHLRKNPAIVLLRMYLDGHRAEADHRIGRSTEARRRWAEMLSDEPLNSAILRNLAVSHSSAADIGPATDAWMRYVESLYLNALISGNVRKDARQRADTHQVLAASFGTAGLVICAPSRGGADADRNVPNILASAARVGVAIAHLRLEWLNHMLMFRSPTLVLGVRRSATHEEVISARDRRNLLVTVGCRDLPPRVRAAFTSEAHATIEDAARRSSPARVRRPVDESEVETHLEWCREKIQWKIRVRNAITAPGTDWPLTEYSGEVIGNLALIDALTLDPHDEYMCRAVRDLGFERDAADFLNDINSLSDEAGRFAYWSIVEAAERDTKDFRDRFWLATRSWGCNQVPDKWIEKLDNPIHLYYSAIYSAQVAARTSPRSLEADDSRTVTAAIPILERWIARLPGASGPVRILSELLSALNREAEAESLLDYARQVCFSEHGRREVQLSFIRLIIDSGQFQEAIAQTLRLRNDATDDLKVRDLLVLAYERWIESGQTVLPGTHQIRQDLGLWTDSDSRRIARRLVSDAVEAKHKSMTGGIYPEVLAVELRLLCKEDTGNNSARYLLVYCLRGLVKLLRNQVAVALPAEVPRLVARLAEARAECLYEARILLSDPTLSSTDRTSVEGYMKEVDTERGSNPVN
ncbi:hypothetical protein [Nocardia concava]|uniref:hypothetical protein n=1 Tax=Nocardia concava TaxID=257281 RepID=UPI0012F90EEE|nr:hypothetical protein [Nocardia concava]